MSHVVAKEQKEQGHQCPLKWGHLHEGCRSQPQEEIEPPSPTCCIHLNHFIEKSVRVCSNTRRARGKKMREKGINFPPLLSKKLLNLLPLIPIQSLGIWRKSRDISHKERNDIWYSCIHSFFLQCWIWCPNPGEEIISRIWNSYGCGEYFLWLA